MTGRSDLKVATTTRPNRFSLAINTYLGSLNDPNPRAAEPAPEAGDRTEQLLNGRVLVGVDESPISYVAVDLAAAEAELHGRPLHLVTVRRTGTDPAGAALLHRLTERVHAQTPTVKVSSRLAIGAGPAQVLLAEASATDLLVVGHWHGAIITALALSVADRIVRQHRGPVLVVRMPGPPPGPEAGARPIVVGVDGSATSRVAYEFALAEARARGCGVTVLHVVGDRMDIAPTVTRDGVPVRHRIISGDPVNRLVEESGRAAAVVLARHPRGTQGGGLFTPGLHLLPQRAHCPVFLVA